jgi:diguanylate cyclase (GGDEF)-like protein/PAS domain S-box-containing protein
MPDRIQDNSPSDKPGVERFQAADRATSEIFFKTLAEGLSEGVLFIAPDGQIIYSNTAAQLIFEPREAFTGLNLIDFVPQAPCNEFLQFVNRMKPGEHISWEFEIRLPSTNIRRISLEGTCLPDAQGIPSGVLGIVEIRANPEYKATGQPPDEQRYRTIVEDQTDLIFRFQPNGMITYVNEAFCRYWSKERSDLIGTSLMASILKEDRPRIRAQFISLTPACPAVSYEVQVNFPANNARWQQRTDRAIFDEKNQPVEFISVGHDITERKLAEKALKHQLALEEIMMNISTRFINVAPSEIDREIQRAMRILGEFLDVDRCYIQVLQADQQDIFRSYEWVARPTSVNFSQLLSEELEHFKWSLHKYNNLEVIRVHHLEDLPSEAQDEKDRWNQMGVRSTLGLPLALGSQLIGFFGFDSERKEIDWSDVDVRLLKVIGEIFVSVWMRKQSLQALQETQDQLDQRILELEGRAREINLLTEMSNMLQIASQFDETYLIVADYAARLFPGARGSLWMANATSNNLTLRNQWGNNPSNAATISSEDCWALRRGRLYYADGEEKALLCKHITSPSPSSSICIPITMQGAIVGLLHFETLPESAAFSDTTQQLLAATAEQVSLALSNLQLRQDLREQAIRDPLTGLYNRYYMEVSLERELNRATRSLNPVSLIILDIDHFKDINERFSHPAGDQVLAELGKILRSSIRAEDIACRFGGEEFILILPDTPVATAQDRAEWLREEVKGLSIWFEGQHLPSITLSLGVACWPQNARDVYTLIRSAENALDQAKQAGRDRVMVAN